MTRNTLQACFPNLFDDLKLGWAIEFIVPLLGITVKQTVDVGERFYHSRYLLGAVHRRTVKQYYDVPVV